MALILPKPLTTLLQEEDTEPQWLIAPILPAQGITFLHGRFSLGKCFAPDTPVLMFDGTVKVAGHVRVGDQVMGPDSKPRTVLETHSGVDQMYRVSPSMGTPWLCNSQHIVGFIDRNGEWAERPVTQVPLGTNKALKRVAVDFPTSAPLPIDPYFIGILLGDGYMRHGVSVTTADTPIVWMLAQQAAKWDLQVKRKGKYSYALIRRKGAFYAHSTRSKGRPASVRNPLHHALRGIGLADKVGVEKHIPDVYRLASQEDRRQLLAGLIDSDGYVNGCTVSFTMKSRLLTEGIAFVAGSLGYRVGSIKAVQKTCTQTQATGTYYSLNFSVPPGVEPPPTILDHKQIVANERAGIGFNIEQAEVGSYVGFSVDGDHLFLLADFTVVHNSPLTWKIAQCVSDGEDFFGLPVATTGPVLYIEVDTPERQVKPRLRLLKPYATQLWMANGYPRLNLMTNSSPEVIELVRAYHDIKPVLVIVNTLRKVHDFDQNTAETPNLVYSNLLQRFPSSALMVVHHDKKSPQQDGMGDPDESFAGSQAWANDATVALHLRSLDKAERRMEVKVTKSQVSPTGSLLKLQLTEDGTNFVDGRQSQICKDFLTYPDDFTYAAKVRLLSELFSCSERTVRRSLETGGFPAPH